MAAAPAPVNTKENCSNLNAIIDELRADQLSSDYNATIENGPFSKSEGKKNVVLWFTENFPPPNASLGQFVGKRIWEDQQIVFSNWMKTCRDLVEIKMDSCVPNPGNGYDEGRYLLKIFNEIIENHESWMNNEPNYYYRNNNILSQKDTGGGRRSRPIPSPLNESLNKLKTAYISLAKWLVENGCRVRKLTSGDKKNYNTILAGATSWIITSIGDRVPSAMNTANRSVSKLEKFFKESLAVVGNSMTTLISGSLFNIGDDEILDKDYYKELNDFYKSLYTGKNGDYSTSNIIKTLNSNNDPTINDFLIGWTGNGYDFERRLLVSAMKNYPEWFTLCIEGNTPVKTAAEINRDIGDYKYYMENAETRARFRKFGLHDVNRDDVLQCDEISFGVIDAGPNPCPNRPIGIGVGQKANATPAGRDNISNLTIELTNTESVVIGSFNMLSEADPNPPNPLVSSQVFSNIGDKNLNIDTGNLPPKGDKRLNTALSAVSAATRVAEVLSTTDFKVNVGVVAPGQKPQNRFQLWLMNGAALKSVQEAFGAKYAGDWAWRAGAYLKTEYPSPPDGYHDCGFVFDDPDRASIYAAVSMALCAGPEHLRPSLSYNPSSKKHGADDDVRAICFASLPPTVADIDTPNQKIKRLSDEDQLTAFSGNTQPENALVSALAGLTLATDFIHDFQEAKRGGPPLVIVGRQMAGGGIDIMVERNESDNYIPVDYDITEDIIDYIHDQIIINSIYAALPDLASEDRDSIIYSDDENEVVPNPTNTDFENLRYIQEETDEFIENQINAQISLYMRSVLFQLYQEGIESEEVYNTIGSDIEERVIGRIENNIEEITSELRGLSKTVFDNMFAYALSVSNEPNGTGANVGLEITSRNNGTGENGGNEKNIFNTSITKDGYGAPASARIPRQEMSFGRRPGQKLGKKPSRLTMSTTLGRQTAPAIKKRSGQRSERSGRPMPASLNKFLKGKIISTGSNEPFRTISIGGSKTKKTLKKSKIKNSKKTKKTKKNKKIQKNQKVSKREKNMKKAKNMKKQKTLRKLRKYKKRSLKK